MTTTSGGLLESQAALTLQDAALPHSAGEAIAVNATEVSEVPIALTAGRRATFRTFGVDGVEDPVLHLLSPSGSQVAIINAQGAGGEEQLSYQPAVSGTFRVVLRAKTALSTGRAGLTLNGEAWTDDLPFAGGLVKLHTIRAGEVLQTTPVPRGMSSVHSMYVIGGDGLNLLARRTGGPAAALNWTADQDHQTVTVVAGALTPGGGGAIRLTRNDAAISGHDADHDGLGTELERSIGTCADYFGVRRGFRCSTATDPADTDGDGIDDGWEYLGKFHISLGAGGFRTGRLPLPLWGANVRHKDLFLEVDMILRCPGDTELRMTPDNARLFAAYYQDEIGSPSIARQDAHAATLRNPDGKTGINVHLDTGVAPASEDDLTLYGDWGGYNVVDPELEECADNTHYQTAWREHMDPARRGVFRHVLAHNGNGGQTAIGSFAISGAISNAAVLVHESGHAMYLGHSGPDRVTGDVDVNCKPNYPSVMNYAFQNLGAGFADGSGNVTLNNASLQESGAVDPDNTLLLDGLEDTFDYWVDRASGSVDWNRDGFMSPATERVQAYANSRPGAACEYTRYNRSDLDEASDVSPAMSSLNGRVYTFYVRTDGRLRFAHTDSDWSCEVPDADAACVTWSTPETLSQEATSVDVERVGTPGRLLVVYVDPGGRLVETRLTLGAGGLQTWSPTTVLPDSSRASGEPSLARQGPCKAYLAYKTITGQLRHRQWTCVNGWGPETPALSDREQPIVLPDFASPGIGYAYLGFRPNRGSFVGAFAETDGTLRLWRLNEITGQWVLIERVDDVGRAEGRPALAWVSSATKTSDGRLYVAWLTHPASPEDRTVRIAMSHTSVRQLPNGHLARQFRIGLRTYLDNNSLRAAGISLLFDRESSSHLISAESRETGDESYISIRPKADGINDFAYTGYNDWETIRTGLCLGVLKSTALPYRVRC
ncbi:hypothetical protein ACLQ2Q_15905 [Microbacterium sp. DT81.1]|uniref:hypothetical protein n=1 Tax=Microbacterium sp. DT81.1 TaxID=3393413 RepID=UPI003CF1FD34